MEAYLRQYYNIQPHKERKSNFELLRIFSMLIIIAHHLIVQGITDYSIGSLSNRIIGALMFPGGRVGVALFFMITGYFLAKKKITSVKKVFLETLFYGWSLAILLTIPYIMDKFFGFNFNYCGIKAILRKLLVPISSGRWWFITAYCLLVLTVPYINLFLEKLNKSGFRLFLFISWFFWYSGVMCFGHADIGLTTAFFFYLFGSYFRLYSLQKTGIFINILLAIIFWTIMAAFYFYFNIPDAEVSKKTQIINFMANIIIHSFIIPLCAWNIFAFFSKIDIKQNQFINIIASTTLGIYLIHVSTIKTIFYRDFFHINQQYLSNLFPLFALIDVFGIFFICSLIDFARLKFIEPRMLKKADMIFITIKNKFFT